MLDTSGTLRKLAGKIWLNKQTVRSTFFEKISECDHHNLETPFFSVSTVTKTGKPQASVFNPQQAEPSSFTQQDCVTGTLRYGKIFESVGMMAHFFFLSSEDQI